MSTECKGKSSWPELVGYSGRFAAAIIERQNKNVNAIVVPEGSGVILNFSCTRVWVWVNKAGKVYKKPRIG
ncbi:hypothetical protein MKW98_024318 [Papaver atlanticum]|uniref:Uncharacterized protein n=1 Tax=Papaver atlanticum TaxID=357466 RepID=A0AAD4XPK3_9MAGN|nr:hypothetical protein MKW98_024318 [Papaver atlanticum]